MTTDKLRAAIEALYHATRYELGGDFHEADYGYKDCERFAEDAMDMAAPQLAALLDAATAPGLDVEQLLVEAIHETCDWEHYMGHESSERDDMLAASLIPALSRRGLTLAALAPSQPESGL